MPLRFIAYTVLGAILVVVSAFAQQYPPPNNYSQPAGQYVSPAGPDQPVQPRLPTLVPRGGQPGAQPPARPQPPPFVLTPQEQAQVEQILKMWEERNRKVKTFDCQFKRWDYDSVFGKPDQPKFVDLGVIKYAAPDKGMFRVDKTEKDGREVAIEDARAEHWVSDGKAIIKYDHVKRQMIVYKLPPERQGKAIADGPLPFLFGSTAEALKDRYFLRIITPRDLERQQIWLEAYPRRLEDAGEFHHAQFIILAQGMSPSALKLFKTNGKDYIVYSFFDIVPNDPLRLFRGDPFRAVRPTGWQTVVEEPSSTQARRPPNDGRR
jgi:TIGR03009 family protein